MADSRPLVAFINPPGPSKLYRSSTCTYVSKANYIWQPQDFVSLSAHIPSRCDLRFFDCSIQGLSAGDFFDRVNDFTPSVAVIAISSIVYDADIDFLRQFRSRFPETRLLVLGDIFLEQPFRDRIFDQGADGIILNPFAVDLERYIATGESESPNLVLKSGGSSRDAGSDTSPRRASIGIPRHELFLSDKYRFPFAKAFRYATVSTQYGCVFQCNYCTQCRIPVTWRPAEEIVRELETLRGLGVHELFFGDPSFGYPRENAVHILRQMTAMKPIMSWACYANPALIEREMLDLMRDAGCHTVIIGVEDTDMEMLKQSYQRNLDRSRLEQFCESCVELKIGICGDFIIGLNNNEASVRAMVAFAKQLRLDYASFNILTPLLGSILRENLIRGGEIDPLTVGYDTSGTFGRNTDELVRLRNMAVKAFYLRPSYLLKRALSIRSFTEFLIQFEEMLGLLKGSLFRNQRKAA